MRGSLLWLWIRNNFFRIRFHIILDPDPVPTLKKKVNRDVLIGLGPYTETIDLCFEPFFVKEIMRLIE
jgi:hypothetical protein